ncbi:serpin family protein [Nitritalea halalkaliphila]|uniref:serpin family protein n=1 Tax=Nitritalea halalkaliphila TaxID=590849 RepID=UPI00058C67B1|nr:serpin family protein [Nitritalea halalkaliphila]
MVPNLRPLSASEELLALSNRAFAEDFSATLRDVSVNQFYSPLSVQLALSMVMNAAGDELREDFLRVLRYDALAVDAANEAAETLVSFLRKLDSRVTFSTANGIWYREGGTLYTPFQEAMKRHFQARLEAADFGNPAVVREINGWVKAETNGLIPELLEAIDPATIMMLVNAVYFKADWKARFDAALTKPAPFRGIQGVRQVQMMELAEAADFPFSATEEYTYVALPYSSGQFQMEVLMVNDPSRAEELLHLETLQAAAERANPQGFRLLFPKFEMRYREEDLVKYMAKMGLEAAFSSHPGNFSRMFEGPTGPTAISDIIHEAFIQVDEKGTEAAAATAVGVVMTSLPAAPPELRIDNPFLFVISEAHSGAILFVGHLVNP